MSLRASTTGMIMMDNVEVPAENMLPNIKGLGGDNTMLTAYPFIDGCYYICSKTSLLIYLQAHLAVSIMLDMASPGELWGLPSSVLTLPDSTPWIGSNSIVLLHKINLFRRSWLIWLQKCLWDYMVSSHKVLAAAC